MSYALHYREELKDPAVVKELDDMVGYFNDYLSKSLANDGTIKPLALVPPQGVDVEGEEHWWRNGPWTFDDPSAVDANKAGIHPPGIPAGTYNDWAPDGIDDCIIIEIGIAGGGGVTFTGMKAPAPVRKRLVLFVNGDSGGTVTLKHANTASQPQNRFSLPNSQDIDIAPKQNVLLYYSLQRSAWTAAITPTLHGGLFGAGSSTGGGDVVGPGSATDSNVAVFDGTTGKLIKDGGQTIAQIIAAAGGGAWTSATVSIGNTALKTLQSAPTTLVAAPGSTLGIIVGSVAVAVTQSVANAYPALRGEFKLLVSSVSTMLLQ